jgi:hypothetical protein
MEGEEGGWTECKGGAQVGRGWSWFGSWSAAVAEAGVEVEGETFLAPALGLNSTGSR